MNALDTGVPLTSWHSIGVTNFSVHLQNDTKYMYMYVVIVAIKEAPCHAHIVITV